MRNLKLTLAYDGSDFHGWQTQPGLRTVQDTLETLLAELTGTRPRVSASGRTDSGVHAVGQVANFRTATAIPASGLMRALNARLPEDVSVRACAEVPPEFDANRDAVRKRYRYAIHDGPARDPFLRRYAYRCKFPLDAAAMAEGARALIGTHDFHSFETEWPNRASSVRTVTRLTVGRLGPLVVLDAEADGFLYNMVRAIAGTLVNVGRGYWPPARVAEILAAEDRREAGPTAPPEGLYLMRVTYD